MRRLLLILALCCIPLTAYAVLMYAYTAWCLATPLTIEWNDYYTTWNNRFAALAVVGVVTAIFSLVMRARLRHRADVGRTAAGGGASDEAQ